jgi:hypothetical protein
MASEPPVPDQVHTLWHSQPTEGVSMSARDVSRKSEEIITKARRRAAGLYMAGAANVAIPVTLMWFLPSLRLGLGYLAVTAVVLMLFVRSRSALQGVAPAMTPSQGLPFYRHLLERERDFRRSSLWWFTIAPALNIVVLALAYVTSPLFRGTSVEWAIVAMVVTTNLVVLARVAQKQRDEAQKSQRELDELAGLIA